MAALNKLFVLLTVNLCTSQAQNLFKSRSPTALDPFVYTRPYVAPYKKKKNAEFRTGWTFLDMCWHVKLNFMVCQLGRT